MLDWTRIPANSKLGRAVCCSVSGHCGRARRAAPPGWPCGIPRRRPVSCGVRCPTGGAQYLIGGIVAKELIFAGFVAILILLKVFESRVPGLVFRAAILLTVAVPPLATIYAIWHL